MGNLYASRADVARLLGRAAFGARAGDFAQWTGRPYADLVASLVDVPDPSTRPLLLDDAKRLGLETARAALAQVQGWWLERMRTTPYPLEERMTLFLHDHFATAVPASGLPDSAMLLHQNQTIRSRALGNFRTLAEELTIDPAMLYWLSGVLNRKAKPNENYARELFELFTLGTIPQVYSEGDIQAAARALTGWTVNTTTRAATFNAAQHDTGNDKNVLGQTITNKGATEYLEVVRIALEQPVAPRYVAYKLVLNFGYVPETTDLLVSPDPLVLAVANALAPGWDLRAAVRTLLLDDRFRSAPESQGRQTVRQPIELAVHAAKVLGFSPDNAQVLAALLRMSQQPFRPPNVSGWPFGKNWLSPTTMIARYDWGITAYGRWSAAAAPLRIPLPASNNLAPGGWPGFLGLASLSPITESVIGGYLSSRPTAPEAEKQTGVLALLMSSPDWMVM